MFPYSIIKLKLEDARQGGEGEGKKTTVNFMPNSNTCLFTQQTSGILAQHNASAITRDLRIQNKSSWLIGLNNEFPDRHCCHQGNKDIAKLSHSHR